VRSRVLYTNKGYLTKHRFQIGVKHLNIVDYLFKVEHVIEILFNLKFMLSNNMSR
jgi:hypothetical protein